MFYKVMKNNRVIDVLPQLIFCKYDTDIQTMVSCKEDEAQAILSSSGNQIWHVSEYPSIPKSVSVNYDTVDVVEIDEYEYEQLKILNHKTPEEIIDAYTLSLIEGGVL